MTQNTPDKLEIARHALEQITTIAEFSTTGPDTTPPCKSRPLTGLQATSLRGSISGLARDALQLISDLHATPKAAPPAPPQEQADRITLPDVLAMITEETNDTLVLKLYAPDQTNGLKYVAGIYSVMPDGGLCPIFDPDQGVLSLVERGDNAMEALGNLENLCNTFDAYKE